MEILRKWQTLEMQKLCRKGTPMGTGTEEAAVRSFNESVQLVLNALEVLSSKRVTDDVLTDVEQMLAQASGGLINEMKRRKNAHL